jgi:hypothetical protein
LHTASKERHAYIVQLADPPLASHTVQGQHLERDSEAARLYVLALEEKQNAVLALVEHAPVQYHYTVSLNGFAALLTENEVSRLKAVPGVTQVSPATVEQLNGAVLKNNQQ